MNTMDKLQEMLTVTALQNLPLQTKATEIVHDTYLFNKIVKCSKLGQLHSNNFRQPWALKK